MELTCPKCHGTMRTYERNGVHVDQCADCRGIFLDRGELDRLIDAERRAAGSGQADRQADVRAVPVAGDVDVVAELAGQPQPHAPARQVLAVRRAVSGEWI